MISIPDALLERLDIQAKAAGETRSGFLQRLAEREVQRAEDRENEEIGRMLESLDIDLGGVDAAQAVREDRESH